MVKILLREVFNLSRISLTKTKTILSIAPRCFRRKQNQIKRKVWSSLSREYPLSENYFREEISGAAVFLQEMLIFGQTGNHNIIHLDNIFCYKIFLSYNMEYQHQTSGSITVGIFDVQTETQLLHCLAGKEQFLPLTMPHKGIGKPSLKNLIISDLFIIAISLETQKEQQCLSSLQGATFFLIKTWLKCSKCKTVTLT